MLNFPEFERTAKELEENATRIMGQVDQKLDNISKLKGKELTFKNVLLPLDDIDYDISFLKNRLSLLASTSLDASLRKKADELDVKISKWVIDISSRKDIYLVLKSFEQTKPKLYGEEKRLLEQNLLDFKRMGFELPPEIQDKIKEIKKELASLESQIDDNIKDANNKTIFLSKDDAKGIEEDALSVLKKNDKGEYIIHAGVQYEIEAITKNSPNEEIRKKVYTLFHSRAKESNAAPMKQVIQRRALLAKLLGYNTWADYKAEMLMTKKADVAVSFIEKLSKDIEPKYQKELNLLQVMKATDTSNLKTKIESWDKEYYIDKYVKQNYKINTEELKKYFPLTQTLNGMYRIYEKLFAIKIDEVKAPYVWAPEVTTIKISDAKSKKELGILYLDLFPRPENEKYGHFAMFSIRPNRFDTSAKKEIRPAAALVCNFPTPSKEAPSLLSLGNVKTLFHEFGHALHELLSNNRFSYFAGVRVANDFVEAPSQLLENWVSEKSVLDSFAANYLNPSEKIPEGTLKKLKELEKVFIGITYRRQFSFALIDLKLHTEIKSDQNFDIISYTNKIANDIYLPYPEEASFITTFSHIFGGYDSSYYGYAWSNNIATDMASLFEKSPQRFMNAKLGIKLRKEIYERGGTRDENKSIRAFLGRSPNSKAFLEKLGIKAM